MTKTEAKTTAFFVRFTSDFGDFVATEHAENLSDIHNITEALHPALGRVVPVVVVKAESRSSVLARKIPDFDRLFDQGKIRWVDDVPVVV
jgi:hypothetical protein